MARHFARGVDPHGLALAPSLAVDAKDGLQARRVRRRGHGDVHLPRHTLPSPHAFVTAVLNGMGWGLQPVALVENRLHEGSLVELEPDTPLNVPLFWWHARAASSLLDDLSRDVLAPARQALRSLPAGRGPD